MTTLYVRRSGKAAMKTRREDTIAVRPSKTFVDRGKVTIGVLLVLTMAFWFIAWYDTNRDLRHEVGARQATDTVAAALTARVKTLESQLRAEGIKPATVFTFLIDGTTYVCTSQATPSAYTCKGT